MVDAYDYMKGYITCQGKIVYLGVYDDSGNEAGAWPLNVYTIYDQLIGAAGDKQKYIDLWNSSPDNRTIGVLSGWYGPFYIELIANCDAPIPAFLGLGGLTSTTPLNARLTEDGDYRITEDGTFRIYE